MHLLAAAPARQAPEPSRRNHANHNKQGHRSGGRNDKDDNNHWHECDDFNEDCNTDYSRQCLMRKSPPGDHDCMIHVSYSDIFH